MYRVDLSRVTRDVGGAVDIRLHAEDDAGNASEILLEPALFVGKIAIPPPRRRSVGH
jgi:hypothetical protein